MNTENKLTENQQSHGHNNPHEHKQSHDHNHPHELNNPHEHNHSLAEDDERMGIKDYITPAFSFILLLAGIIMSRLNVSLFVGNKWVQLIWYAVAFIPVGFPVIKEAIEGIAAKDYFNEFTLMSIACIGAFCIGEYPEGVGVMLFYSIGEKLQDGAVGRATRSISKLLDVRVRHAIVIRDGESVSLLPENVKIGDTIEVKPGERVPLDGILESSIGTFDTSALTGESIPRVIESGDEVLAGMITTDTTVRIKVNRSYSDSALSRILDMVKNAQGRKARTELFIRRFARIYTPAVILLAALIVLIPWIIGILTPSFTYIFTEWLYRALVFLVISCPCALVISVPLGYFAGIGAASRCGILFKGGNYLEGVTRLNAIAFDKTGTLTTGDFSIEKVVSAYNDKVGLLTLTGSAELNSTHPLAKAIVRYAKEEGVELRTPETMKEITGFGTEAVIDGKKIVAGNLKLLSRNGIEYPEDINSECGTIIAVGIDGRYAGYVLLKDTIKPESKRGIENLRELGINDIIMLSGDKKEIVADYAGRLGITEYHGELLPADKAAYIERASKTPDTSIGFVGDGMNDAPVLALSDVGIAMGGLGSDVAIESADVVIQTDNPLRVATVIKIGRFTHKIVKENIIGAISIKIIIMILGALGIATLWGAVFADVGVALLAVLNSMRIMWGKRVYQN